MKRIGYILIFTFLFGKNIGYSFSRGFFANQFQEWQLPHTYVNFDLPDIHEFLSLKKLHPNLSGCNVTVPYKQSIIPYLNKLSEAAQQIGAVNCIAFDQNKTIGHNTDVVGFAHSINQLILPNVPWINHVQSFINLDKTIINLTKTIIILPRLLYQSCQRSIFQFFYFTVAINQKQVTDHIRE